MSGFLRFRVLGSSLFVESLFNNTFFGLAEMLSPSLNFQATKKNKPCAWDKWVFPNIHNHIRAYRAYIGSRVSYFRKSRALLGSRQITFLGSPGAGNYSTKHLKAPSLKP